MKIGEYKIKRHYQIIQMVVDVFSVALLVVILQCTLSFRENVLKINEAMPPADLQKYGLINWLPNIAWLIAAAAFMMISVILTYKNRKIPKKYKIINKNAQKYSDIVITAITCIKIPVLLAIFDMMYVHQRYILHQSQSFFSLQVLLDVLLVVIIVRFSVHRVHGIEPKEEERSHEIIEG